MRPLSRLALILAIMTGTALPAAGTDERPAPFASEEPAGDVPDDWIRYAVIYELFVRNFTPEGTFRAVIPHLPEIRRLGATVIWLMPIHPIGEEKRKGELGSPYSIRDFYDVNPDMGTREDFRALVDAIHENGMRVILDMVANHTAWDNAWVSENPHWYVTNEAGEIVPPVEDWWDVADLNYNEPEVRREMAGVLRYWVEEFNIDGYRCDVAEMVPLDFWKDAIAEIRQIKPLLMLAEGESPELYANGFDLTYSWDPYHTLVRHVWPGGSATAFVEQVRSERRALPDHGIRMRFTTNHDETAWDRTPLEKFHSIAGARAAAVLMSLLPGVPMVYNGQEVGTNVRYGLFEQTPIDWDRNPEMRSFYEQLFHIRRSNEALLDGAFMFHEHEYEKDVVMYTRRAGDERVLVIVNVRDEPREITLPRGFRPGSKRDAFSGETVTSGEILLEPFGYRVLIREKESG